MSLNVDRHYSRQRSAGWHAHVTISLTSFRSILCWTWSTSTRLHHPRAKDRVDANESARLSGNRRADQARSMAKYCDLWTIRGVTRFASIRRGKSKGARPIAEAYDVVGA